MNYKIKMTSTDNLDVNIDDELMPMQTSTNMVLFKYGPDDSLIQVHVPEETLLKFRVISDVNTDCDTVDGKLFACIPLIKDADLKPVYFTKEELELFFALAALNPLTIQHKDRESTYNLLARFLLLANYLHNDIYINTLAEYVGTFYIEYIL